MPVSHLALNQHFSGHLRYASKRSPVIVIPDELVIGKNTMFKHPNLEESIGRDLREASQHLLPTS